MADVNLVVRAHLRGERELNKAERKLLRIAVAAKAADNSMASLGASSAKMQKILSRTTAKFEKIMTDWDKLVKGFGVLIVKTLGAATKFMVAEFALVAASMITVHALFKVGRWLMKGYHGAIKMIAGAAAGATAALATLSAAIREQQAAMFSYKGLERNYKDLKSGIAAVRSEMRGMSTDVTMAAMGIENLNTMFAGASQRGTFNRGLAKGLFDIASAGQPLEAAAKWVGEIVGILTDPDVNTSDIAKSFKGLGELGEKTWEKLAKRGITSVAQVQNAIRTGLVSELAGVEGQWDAVSGTLVSKLKAAFTIIRTDFADIGDAFLGDIKGSLDEMVVIMRRMMFSIRGDIVKFGKGGLLGSMVGAMEAIERNMIKLIDKWLPMAEGMFGRIADWWGRFTDGWDKVTSSLAPLLSAAYILEDMFMNILRPVGDYFSDSFRKLRIFLIDSKDDFLEHGSAIGRLLEALLEFQSRWTEMFKEAMPFINKLIDGITQLVDLFTGFASLVRQVAGGIANFAGGMGGKAGGSGGSGGFGGAYAMMALMQFGRRNRDTEGTIIDSSGALDLKSLSQMNVQAQVVNLSGPGGPAAAGGKGARKPGYAPYMPGKDMDDRATEVGYAPSAATITDGGRATPLFGSNVSWDKNTNRYRELGGGGMMPFVSKEDAEKAILSRPRQTPGGHWYQSARVEDGVGVGGKRISEAEALLRNKHIEMRKNDIFTAEAVQGSGIHQQITQSGFLSLGRQAGWDPVAESLAPGHAARREMLDAGGGGIDALMKSAGVVPGEGTDFTKMRPNELAMLMGSREAPDELPLGPNGEMVKNPYKGKGVGKALMERIRGQDKGGAGLKASMKAAIARQRMLATTQVTGMDPNMPKTAGARLKHRMGKRLGTGSAMHQRYSKGLKGFGSRMGIGMGMGMASGFMGEEAQGAMNLGSMVSMVNPLLGMGIGFGGAALKAKTVKGGMATGAMGGAAIGGMFGPGGALVGAAAGALVGGIMGALGKGRAAVAEVEASARDTASEIWGGMIEGINEARLDGPMTGARMKQAMNVGALKDILHAGRRANQMPTKGGRRWDSATGRYIDQTANERMGHAQRQAVVTDIFKNQDELGIEMSQEEYEKNMKRPFEFIAEILPELTKHHGVATTVLDKYGNRMEHMTDMFDVSEEKLLEMANTVGVNLYDATMETTEMIKKLSGALMQTRDDVNNVFQDIMNTTYSTFDTALQKIEGEIGMDESARAFKELADSGELDPTTVEGQEVVLNFLKEQMGFATDLAGGDTMAATGMINDLYGKGKAFTQAGGSMEGLGSFFRDPLIRSALQEQMETTGTAKPQAMMQAVISNLGTQGLQATYGADFEATMGGLSGGKRDEMFRLFEDMAALETGQYKDEGGDLTTMGQDVLQQRLNAILGTGTVSNLVAIAEGAGTEAIGPADMEGFADTFGTSVGDFKVAVDDLVNKIGAGVSDTKHPFGDTSSNLTGTLAAHGRISGGLPGKRTITSGYRNYALGSSNSDHVNGRALDIVGDNLGAYQRGIKSGGGYAEFHGGGRSRHLHTVPAIGDTSMSKGGLGSASNTNNYNINVTGGPNANSQEVATLVMNEIKNLDRSNRERS